ncbi:hypothetical protein ECC02_003509 [Trypanosoma cruzi]|uniref:Uncharacterized protein n=1 Tax=Trypanosoma cruzi TaxID=5693 RepID=A0A7J6YB28_TRYCR|nr:hypothetical protein ECC02_003509 [Trypanosoma cruzi]
MTKPVVVPAHGDGAPVSGPSEAAVTVVDVEAEEEKEEEAQTARGEEGPNKAAETVRRRDPNKIDPPLGQQQEPLPRGERLAKRMLTLQRWELPALVPSPTRRSKHERRISGGNSRSPVGVAHNARQNELLLSPPRPYLERPEQQLELYHSLQKRKFVTLHEELHHLRMSHVHAQKTLRLRGEEVKRLRRELEEKTREIERLKSLIAVLRKAHHQANGSVAETDAVESAGPATVSPSLALFAATAADGVGGGRGAEARLLLQLRQNIASRDTIISDLRMELSALRQAKKEADEKVNKLTAEVAEMHARCEKLSAELGVKDKTIEELEKRCAGAQMSEVNGGIGKSGNDNSDGTSSSDVLELRQKLEEYRLHHRAADDVIEGIQQQLQRIEAMGLCVPHCNSTGKLPSQQEEGLRGELMHLRQCLDREEETRAESERLWRRSHEADLRMLETELCSTKAEAEAYKREVARMQKQIATAGFMEAQLQAARNENDALQQRVCELREENIAQSSREKELLHELRSTKEAQDRREEEVSSLQRRLRNSKENEDRLRKEVEMLEGRLRAVERGLSDAPPPYELISYAALMKLNADLQERLKTLETEPQKAKKTPPLVNTTDDVTLLEAGGDIAMEPVARATVEEEGPNARMEQGGACLHGVPEQSATSIAPSEPLQVKLKDVHDAYRTPSHRLDEVSLELVSPEQCGAVSAESTKRVNKEAGKAHCKSAIRSRLQDVQWHAIMTANGSDATDKLRAEVSRLRKCLKTCEEELEQTRMELEATKLELDNARRQQVAYNGPTQGVGERKVSSLRAARMELEHWRQLAVEHESALVELKKRYEGLKIAIASLQESTQVSPNTSAPVSAFVLPDWVACNDEHIIEEALRDETARIDEDMNKLRRELHTMRKDRDHWMAVATGLSKPA